MMFIGFVIAYQIAIFHKIDNNIYTSYCLIMVVLLPIRVNKTHLCWCGHNFLGNSCARIPLQYKNWTQVLKSLFVSMSIHKRFLRKITWICRNYFPAKIFIISVGKTRKIIIGLRLFISSYFLPVICILYTIKVSFRN